MLGSIIALSSRLFILADFDRNLCAKFHQFGSFVFAMVKNVALVLRSSTAFSSILVCSLLRGSAFHLFQQSDEVGVTNRMSLLRSPHFPLFHPILRNNGKWSSRNKTQTHFGLGPVTWCGNSETKRALITEPSRSIHSATSLLSSPCHSRLREMI